MAHWGGNRSLRDLDPEKLAFIDETWTTTNMARKCGRAPKGERLRAGVPHGHWKTTTFIASLRCDRLTALTGLRRLSLSVSNCLVRPPLVGRENASSPKQRAIPNIYPSFDL
jgi:hypothetical protein